jgi:hypothetical protein
MPEPINYSIEHYKRVCSQIDWYAQRMADAFKLFVQALNRNNWWTYLTKDTAWCGDRRVNIFIGAMDRVPMHALFTIAQILSDLRTWYGFRHAEAALLQREDLRPKLGVG